MEYIQKKKSQHTDTYKWNDMKKNMQTSFVESTSTFTFYGQMDKCEIEKRRRQNMRENEVAFIRTNSPTPNLSNQKNRLKIKQRYTLKRDVK